MRFDAFGRRADDGIALAAQKSFELRLATGPNGLLLQPGYARGIELFNDKFHQRVVEAAVADKADFFSRQLLTSVDAWPAEEELLVDAAGQKYNIGFTFEVGAKRRGRGHIAELNFA